MEYKEKFLHWKNSTFFDYETTAELESLDLLKDQKEIEDRFYRDLKFGTGGLRGIMGAGTNRINKYTIGKATLGFGRFLINKYGSDECINRGVVVGYDTRNNSQKYSRIVANILSSMNIRVHLHLNPRPTPQISYSVRFWNALGGVVITASHNPKEYNGYKIYDIHGCQLVPNEAKLVSKYIDDIKDYEALDFTGKSCLIDVKDNTDEFVSEVIKQSRYSDMSSKRKLKITYSPLHGTGYVPISKCLISAGFSGLNFVKEQVIPDGDFSTVSSPNPEDRDSMVIALEEACKVDSDIVLGTDPDCDRVGVAVKTQDGYHMLNGNQIGVLLTDYILENTDIKSIYKPTIIKTIVTSELGAEICKKHGVTIFSTLTGFKYIGEKIIQFEKAKLNGNTKEDNTFIFGYEESNGYLVGTHAKDKDAVVACLLICEMAAYHKNNGKNLVDRLNELYSIYGYYKDEIESFIMRGKDGEERINKIMSNARTRGLDLDNCIKYIDYNIPNKSDNRLDILPTSNVLKYIFKDGSWVVIRPSGTEPKLKIYYSIISKNKKNAECKFKSIKEGILKSLKVNQ